MSFLGLILESVKQEICLPSDKPEELMHKFDRWSTRCKATKRELLSLIGKLSFAVRAVPAGCLFSHCLITLALTAAHLHHQIRLNAKACAYITWVADIPANLEWHSHVYRSELSAGCGYAPVHRRLWLLWLWCLLPRCLVLLRLATTPTPSVDPVERAVCHCGSSFDVGTQMAGKTGEIHV